MRVPDGWKLVPIKEICSCIIDCVNKTAPIVDYETPYKMIRTTNVRNGRVDTKNVRCVTEETYNKWTRRGSPKSGDLIFTREAPVGEVGIIEDAEGVFLGQRTVMYRAHPQKSNNLFILYSLQSRFCKKQIEDFSNGGTVSHVRVPDCSEIILKTPRLPEQQKIAQILSTWDKAIEKLEALITAKQTSKKALMQRLLTGKIRFSDFNGEWQYLKADELFKPVSKKTNGDKDELLAVTQDQGVLPRNLLDRRVVMPEGNTEGYKLVVPGDFIISLRSFQGGLEYSNCRGLVSPAYTVLQPIIKICADFYRHYFKSYDFIGHLAVAVIGIRDGKQISYSDFSFLKLPYPPIEEQQEIAAVLSAADNEITIHQNQLAALNQQKNGLMQQLLTGKKRVNVNQAAA